MKGLSSVYAFLPCLLLGAFIPLSCLHNGLAMNPKDRSAVEVIYKGVSCPSEEAEAHVRWITSRDALESVWQAIHRSRVGLAVPSVPDVDFTSHGVLLVHMGTKTTGGYAIELADATFAVKEQAATVSVDWLVPPSDRVVPQVMTTPCLILKLIKGDYKRIDVVDRKGIVRVSTDMKAATNSD